MRKGHLKYIISPDLTIEAEYEVANKHLTLKLVSPCSLEYQCTFTRDEADNDSFDRGYAIFELKNLIEKIFYIKKHREGFEFVLSEYKRAERQEEFSPLDLIGYFDHLIKEHVSPDLLPFWINIYLLEDILKDLN